MAFFESRKGFWLMFTILMGIVVITVILRIDNLMNFWNKISGAASSFKIK
jgi:hypothetical protein